MKKKNTKVNGKEKNMKTRNKIFVLVSVIVVLIGYLFYVTNNINSNFWSTNELRLVMEFNIIDDEEEAQTVLDKETSDEKKADSSIYAEINSLKDGICKFFKDEYSVNVTDKMSSLKEVYTYSSTAYKGQSLYGYVNGKDATVHLNTEILENEDLLNSVFTHEVMHYLGIVPNEKNECYYFIEGMAEALAENCMAYMDKTFIRSDVYDAQANLAKQILIVDKDIVVNSIKDGECNIGQKITKKLKGVKRSFLDIDDVGENLECCISSIFYGTDVNSEQIIKFQAEEIVTSYIKTFAPTKEQIKEVRKYYLDKEYEKMEVNVENDTVTLVCP